MRERGIELGPSHTDLETGQRLSDQQSKATMSILDSLWMVA